MPDQRSFAQGTFLLSILEGSFAFNLEEDLKDEKERKPLQFHIGGYSLNLNLIIYLRVYKLVYPYRGSNF
jgi:hypothetical protein